MKDKMLHFFDNIEEYIITALLPVMCMTIFVSTVGRFTKLFSFPWAEELARYLMVWLAMLGVSVGAKSNAHFAVNALVDLFPKAGRRFFFLLRTAISLVFCGLVAFLAIKVMQVQVLMNQSSPAMAIPIWIAYAAIPVGLGSMVIRTIQFCIVDRKTSSTQEEGA